MIVVFIFLFICVAKAQVEMTSTVAEKAAKDKKTAAKRAAIRRFRHARLGHVGRRIK